MLSILLEIFNPPIQSGANWFIWIVVILIGFAVAVGNLDAFTENNKKEPKVGKDDKLK